MRIVLALLLSAVMFFSLRSEIPSLENWSDRASLSLQNYVGQMSYYVDNGFSRVKATKLTFFQKDREIEQSVEQMKGEFSKTKDQVIERFQRAKDAITKNENAGETEKNQSGTRDTSS